MAAPGGNGEAAGTTEGQGAAVWEIDGSGRYLSFVASDDGLLGLPPGGWAADPQARVYPGDRDLIAAARAAALAGDGAYAVEYRVQRADGALSWVRESGRLVGKDPSGPRFKGATVLIGIEKALEERYLHSQRLESVGRLVGGVAHDFSNVAMALIGYSDILLQLLDEKHEGRVYAGELREIAQRGVSLVRQLLAFSRRQETEWAWVDMNATVESLGRLLRRLIGEDVRLETRLTSRSTVIRADQAQMEQVVMNLMVNARDAMPRGGRLTVETDTREVSGEEAGVPPGGYVVLRVTDTGHGMDEATLARIFEPFFTTKARGRGTGLGLALVQEIVAKSGGHVAVRSQPEEGTTFEILLPARTSDAGIVDAATVAEETPGGTERVLVIDDDVVVRRLIAQGLRRKGYTVFEAADGGEGVTLAQGQEQLDLMVVDLIMPDMNGTDAVRLVRRLHPEVQPIYITGYRDRLHSDQLDLEGGVLMEKPFRLDDLVRRARAVIDATPAG